MSNHPRGATGRLYWIDFETVRLASQPRWEADLVKEQELLAELFGIREETPEPSEGRMLRQA